MLGECLQSLCEQTYSNFEILVVNNGSTDGSQEYVRSHFPDVRLWSGVFEVFQRLPWKPDALW